MTQSAHSKLLQHSDAGIHLSCNNHRDTCVRWDVPPRSRCCCQIRQGQFHLFTLVDSSCKFLLLQAGSTIAQVSGVKFTHTSFSLVNASLLRTTWWDKTGNGWRAVPPTSLQQSHRKRLKTLLNNWPNRICLFCCLSSSRTATPKWVFMGKLFTAESFIMVWSDVSLVNNITLFPKDCI